MIKVILLIDCASEHDRKLLRGIMRYSKENGPWLFYRLSPDARFSDNREEWVLQWAKQWKADAIIGRWNDNKMHLLNDLDIPIVLQNNSDRSNVFSNLTGDYDSTGRMAADYFRKKLYTEYAFFGIKDIVWSEERCKGYKEEVLKNNGNFYSYVENINGDNRESILEWLKCLPKPIALFCCDDAHAQFITETCKIAGINVPDDIAILGVDDDELLCNISDPPISSIEMNVEQGGYTTCKKLHDLILSNSKNPFNVWITPLGIKIIRYIDDNFSKDICMGDILAAVPLSRRSIEMRFKKATKHTIYQYLLHVRIEHYAYLIKTTSSPYDELAYQVGFHDLSNVARIFRRYKGCTPSEFRKNCVI